ncbi:MAG: NIPSNAP family protein [Chloroflexota bacterium]
MLYELRISRTRMGGQRELEERMADALPRRLRHSPLAGAWHTEIGPLFQVIELWPYESAEHYAEISSAVAADGGWPPTVGDLIMRTDVELLTPTPWCRELNGTPAKYGPIYELRRYQAKAGGVPTLLERWAPRVPGRDALSPLLGNWHTPSGLWIHLWPYPDLATRVATRERAIAEKVWPPAAGEAMLTQESWIMLPTTFSPLQ